MRKCRKSLVGWWQTCWISGRASLSWSLVPKSQVHIYYCIKVCKVCYIWVRIWGIFESFLPHNFGRTVAPQVQEAMIANFPVTFLQLEWSICLTTPLWLTMHRLPEGRIGGREGRELWEPSACKISRNSYLQWKKSYFNHWEDQLQTCTYACALWLAFCAGTKALPASTFSATL